MKKLLSILVAVLAVQSAAVASAAEPEERFNILLTGGPSQDVIGVKVSIDGRSYIIDSLNGPLEAPLGICQHREEKENALLCEATKIASFEVNAGAGHDHVIISPKVPVPVTLRGGPGNDRLYGGAGADKLIGGPGHDYIYGRGGNDWIYGGPGDDFLYGGPGDDRLFGGTGNNTFFGGGGTNQIG